MWVTSKLGSAEHRIRSYLFRKSRRWTEHPLNPRRVRLPKEDWNAVHLELEQLAPQLGFEICDFEVPSVEYLGFKTRCKVGPLYALGYHEKKILEHFIAFKLLNLQPHEVYVDVASEYSPFPKIFRERFGVDSFSQDISYKPGIHGRRIGSSAESIPLPDRTVDKVSLQCAFEHFEGDIDAKFIDELGRILKPGGQCVIVPLYVSRNHLNIVDPVLDYSRIRFDDGAAVIAETNLGGAFERVYSPRALKRILGKGEWEQRIYRIRALENITDEPVAFRIRYALQMKKIR